MASEIIVIMSGLQLCGKGYTRAPDNTTCIPCNCFGHSDDCDGETGQCYNCLHNTTGTANHGSVSLN